MAYTPRSQLGRGITIGFTPVGGSAEAFLSLVSIKPPGTTVGEVENVLASSTFEAYLPTLPAGEGSFKVQHWDGDPGCVAMQAAVQSAPVPTGTFLITMPVSGSTISFVGFPKGYEIDETDNKEIITATISYRQNGPTTVTPPTALV